MTKIRVHAEQILLSTWEESHSWARSSIPNLLHCQSLPPTMCVTVVGEAPVSRLFVLSEGWVWKRKEQEDQCDRCSEPGKDRLICASGNAGIDQHSLKKMKSYTLLLAEFFPFLIMKQGSLTDTYYFPSVF